MAKHPHRLIFINKKTWKCTLPGCSFFVHTGLAHVLEGKTAVCWNCNETFTIDTYALRDEMPKCIDCRSGSLVKAISPTEADLDLDEFQQVQAVKYKNNVQSLGDLHPDLIRNLQSIGQLPKYIPLKYLIPSETQIDEIEVYEPESEEIEIHAADCEIYSEGECTCK